MECKGNVTRVQWHCDNCEEREQENTAGVQTQNEEENYVLNTNYVFIMSSSFPNISNPANNCPKGGGWVSIVQMRKPRVINIL